jgi:uncharacterized protein YuzE
MTIDYDPQVDAAFINLSESTPTRTSEESDVCILDYDDAGNLVRIELLSVFGFAGASLHELAARGIISTQLAERALQELRCELVAA